MARAEPSSARTFDSVVTAGLRGMRERRPTPTSATVRTIRRAGGPANDGRLMDPDQGPGRGIDPATHT